MIGSYFQKSGIYIFLIASACVYYLLNAPLLLGHYDLGWHLAAGDLIRSQGSVPFHDPWSYTIGGRQWFNLSWLWDVLASALFQHTGFNGLIGFVIAGGAAIILCLTRIGLSSGASPIAVCISVLAASLLFSAYTAFPNIYLTASPNITTMLLSVIFYGVCLNGTRYVLLLPAIMALWVNLHGGFLNGLIIVGAFGGLALFKRDWRSFKIYSLVGAGCFVATFINPLGWHIYEGLKVTLGHFVQDYVTEWWPYYRSITVPESIPGILYILTFVTLELRYRGFCPAGARLLSWLFLFLGLYQFRYMSFFFMFSTVPLALHLDRLLPKRAGTERALLVAGIAAACALLLVYGRIDRTLGLPQMLTKQDALYLKTHFPHARLLNHWNYGGLFIFYTRGAVPVFVDGRASTAYPDGLLRDYFKLVNQKIDEAGWDSVLAKYRVDTVLWMNTHKELRQFIVEKRGWKEAYRGMYASIYVKP